MSILENRLHAPLRGGSGGCSPPNSWAPLGPLSAEVNVWQMLGNFQVPIESSWLLGAAFVSSPQTHSLRNLMALM